MTQEGCAMVNLASLVPDHCRWFPWPNTCTSEKTWNKQRLTDHANLSIKLKKCQHNNKDVFCPAVSVCYFFHFLFPSSIFVVLNSFLLSFNLFYHFTSFIPTGFISQNASISVQFGLVLLLKASQFSLYYFNTLHNSLNIICWLFLVARIFYLMKVVIKTSSKILKYPYCDLTTLQL